MLRNILIIGGLALFGTLSVETAAKASRNSLIRPDFKKRFAGYDACFIIREVRSGESIRYNEQRCTQRFSPCGTFKIAHSLIGLETGIIKNPSAPQFRWDGERYPNRPEWEGNQSLHSAFKSSVIWVFRQLATQIGPQRMQQYLHRIHYGNEDISGGIARFWQLSSLEVSADEQAALVEKLVKNNLPMSPKTMQTVRNILLIEKVKDGALYGNTGSGGVQGPPGKAILGWFVGYITKGKRVYAFATNISADDGATGLKARQITRDILKEMKLAE